MPVALLVGMPLKRRTMPVSSFELFYDTWRFYDTHVSPFDLNTVILAIMVPKV